jgi:hypothetical protein
MRFPFDSSTRPDDRDQISARSSERNAKISGALGQKVAILYFCRSESVLRLAASASADRLGHRATAKFHCARMQIRSSSGTICLQSVECLMIGSGFLLWVSAVGFCCGFLLWVSAVGF